MADDDLVTVVGNPGEPPPALQDQVADMTEYMADFYTSMKAVSPEMVRGIRVFQILQALPLLWFHGDLPSLYQLSEASAELDEFWSHSWRASLWIKYVNILYLNNCSLASGVGTFFAALAALLYYVGVLPVWESGYPRCRWSTIFGIAAFYLSLLLYRRSKLVFFDIGCIHQRDGALKIRGLLSLGAVLKSSKSLQVLWHRTFVTRLWCLFEIGAFLHIRQEEKRPLAVCPPLLGPGALGFHVCASLFVCAVLFLVQLRQIAMSGLILVGCLFFLSFTMFVHAMRAYCRDIDTMQRQLMEFSVSSATSHCCESSSCANHVSICDREVILQCIVAWFGSVENFEIHVRSDVRVSMAGQLANGAFLYHRILSATTPLFWFYFDVTISVKDHRKLPSLFRSLALWLAALPCLVKLMLHLSYRLRTKRGSVCADCLVSAGLMLSVSLLVFALLVGGIYLFDPNDDSMMKTLTFFFLSILITGLVWQKVPTIRLDPHPSSLPAC
ncbi:unnamed protein product [Symbiodinium natans]|uniref:Uncharacterized protein n=1 Tax=Symbiodinium natans TaxID=878477 RepID=A0A812PK47_9DINO|nr:unnamed protein product [Symbiodinium natans]